MFMEMHLHRAMTDETPSKVLGLLAACALSLAFMFAVSASDASFSGTYAAVPEPINSEHVVAAIDTVSARYSEFIVANLSMPVSKDLAVMADNSSWVAGNARDGFASLTGIGSPSAVQDDGMFYAEAAAPHGRVAGASTGSQYESGNINVDSLFRLLFD